MSLTEKLKKLVAEFGESFIETMTADDYETVLDRLGWSESQYAGVLRHLNLDASNLETKRVQRSQQERLASVFTTAELRRLSYRDYDKVKERLGWSQSTFRTVLRGMGRETGNLREGRRTYVPTDAEIRTLETEISRSLVRTLTVTGCRFGELWRMGLDCGELTIFTQKGGLKVSLALGSMDEETGRLIESWVNHESDQVSESAARKRWQRLIESGKLDAACTPHTLRHRAVTKLLEAGESIETVAEMVGHKSILTTRRYGHADRGKVAASVLVPKREDES